MRKLVAMHSVIMLANDDLAALTLASLMSSEKEGNATDASIPKTATTTTSSSSENPFTSGDFLGDVSWVFTGFCLI